MKYHVSFDLEFKKNKSKGIYIALEGIDGSGKTTQTERLVQYFESKENPVIKTREPRKEGVIGDLVHKILKGNVKFPPQALQYLFSTDRILNHYEVILPALEQGTSVISDRCFWSAVVYGILDKSLDSYDYKSTDQLLIAQSILSMYHQFTAPDLIFYLRIPLEESLKRLDAKDDTKEIYESKAKIEGVLNGYEWMVKNFKDQFIIIDGTKSEDEIAEELIAKIESFKK